MDTIQHAYAPALATYSITQNVEQSLMAGAIGALPDIGTAIKRFITGNWKIYEMLHSKTAAAITFGLSLIGTRIPDAPSWLVLGLLFYAVHCVLDWPTHGTGKRWYIWEERFWAEALAWAILIILAIPVNIWFVLAGGIVLLVATVIIVGEAIGRALFIIPLLFLPALSQSQEIYHDCGMEGGGFSEGLNQKKEAELRELNRWKNRYVLPGKNDFDSTVTLERMYAPGDDRARFDQRKAARIVGYVTGMKPGGIESCNCKATDLYYRDIHIELAVHPDSNKPTQRIVVEPTPRFRKMMEAKGIDWTYAAVRKAFLHKWVVIEGWMFFDAEHDKDSFNLNPKNKHAWRRTAWEIHPVTAMHLN